jgi:NADH-quinone oxidoreductase subunit L
MTGFVWLIPLFPLIGFLINGLLFRKLSPRYSGIVGWGVILLSFISSVILFIETLNHPEPQLINLFSWIDSGNIHIGFSFLVDPLSALMLLIITGVGFLIHVYSVGYMRGDGGFNRFFSFMNLFVFFMLILVLASNYAVMFIGWEGVGLCSYLLIGFWFQNPAFNSAAKKAFIMNRIGDLGFLLGIFLLFNTFGTLDFSEIFTQASAMSIGTPVVISITLLLFIGATGKSAQIPLFTWLPDAMAGPTPVSALIHAATMVTAGVYMVARSNILYTLAPVTQLIVAAVGLLTAIMAASTALYQNDIKKVLAYSTISQLGFMFLALGVGSYTGAMFHLTTHAFFKALLFLAAGSVIHALNGEQDIRKMGGLRKPMRITFIVFLIGTLAISGIPPLSGFFSKDEILSSAYSSNMLWWFFGILASLLTAFYMFRLLYLTFYGDHRGSTDVRNLHKTPKSILIPLITLAVLAAIGGFIGMPDAFLLPNFMESYLSPVFQNSYHLLRTETVLPGEFTEGILMAVAFIGILGSIGMAYHFYIRKKRIPSKENPKGFLPKLLFKKYYGDEVYDFLFVKPHKFLSEKLHEIVELKIIDKLVENLGKLTLRRGYTARFLQTGVFSFYLFVMVIFIILILFLNLII